MWSTRSILVSSSVLGGLVASAALIFNREGQPLQASLGFSLAAFIFTVILIPAMKGAFIKAGFSGKDLSKVKQPLLYHSFQHDPHLIVVLRAWAQSQLWSIFSPCFASFHFHFINISLQKPQVVEIGMLNRCCRVPLRMDVRYICSLIIRLHLCPSKTNGSLESILPQCSVFKV